MVVLAGLALGLTGPGQTAGISVFIDPMIATLELSRTQVASAYLVATLIGAVVLQRIGRMIDARGARLAMAVVGALFALLLAVMAGVAGLVTLTLGLVGIRMFGQGGLNLVATTAVAPWFDRRRGLALGITTALGSAIIAITPIGSELLIRAVGWRPAWAVLGLLVAVLVLPIALRGLIDRPEDVGQIPDGDPAPDPDAPVPAAQVGFSKREALRTPMFWTVAAAVATTGMVGTGLSFHQIDLLGEQGLRPVEAAANFLPQTLAALTSTVVVGALIDRLAPRWILLGSMSCLAGAMVAVPFIAPGWSALAYGAAVGTAGSATRALEAAAFPRLFGLGSLGAIRGVVAAIMVASTAFGPLALSIGRDITGSYVQVLLILLLLPVAVVLAAFVARVPQPPVPDDVARPG